MLKAQEFPLSHDPATKALIIYDEFSTAVRANVALQHSARNADFAVQWNVKPWQINMLKFPLTAEEALSEALDAHLIVIASPGAKSSTFWFQGWLEHWAKCRQIKEAALAFLGDGSSDGLAALAISKCSSIAQRHGLSLIFDDGRSGKDQSDIIGYALDGEKFLAFRPAMPIPDGQIRHAHSCWGINE